jgi:thioredoxin-related protein
MSFVCLQAKCVGSQSDTQLAFCNISKGDCYYCAKQKKHFREDLILPELLSDNLSDVLEDSFQNHDFVRETKIVP